MQKQILFFTLICTIFATHAADDTMLTLEGNDGQCITIPASVAKHSQTLANIIGDCPVNQTVPVTNFNAQELDVLVDVLNTIHCALSDDDTVTALRTMVNAESEHSLAAIHDFFDIGILRQALAKHFFNAFGLNKAESILEKAAAVTKICNCLWISSTNDKMDAITKEKSAVIHRVIENMRLTDKGTFLCSKGKDIGLFFTGVSIGEAAQHDLINMNYIPSDSINHTRSISDFVINELFNNPLDHVRHFDVRIFPYRVFPDDCLTSLEGLKCDSPIDITNKIRTIWIHKACIGHLPADIFQYAQDPEVLLINNNKIASIDPHAFRGLLSLKTLHLCKNNLTHIPAILFKPLLNLEELSLSYNKLTHIHASMFEHCKKLKTLDLLNTLIPLREIATLRAELPNTKIYFSFSPLVASNYSLMNS